MPKRRRRLSKFALTVGLILLIILFLSLQSNVTELISTVSKASIDAITKTAVNDAVLFTLDGAEYENLITVTRDETGNVTSISANASKINKIARTTASLSQANLNKLTKNGINVPFGVFTGIRWLATFGDDVKIQILPISSVSCDFFSNFCDAGINQTKHSLYLKVEAKVTVVAPATTLTVLSNTEILVCESVITGKIPNTYLDGILMKK